MFEQGDQLAHRLAQVVVAQPEQGILARGRWDSSKAGWLERPGGKRHLDANHLRCKLEQIKGVCCEGSVPALPWRDRGKQQELSRATIHLYNLYISACILYISTTCILDTRRKVKIHIEQCAGTIPRSDPDTGQHALDGANLLFFKTAQL